MKKAFIRAISIIMAAALLLPVFAVAGAATVKDVTSLTAAPEGYTAITTPAQLDAVRNDLDGKYILMNYIDLAAYENWIPIGTKAAPFTGEMDGNGFLIANLSSFGGLFGSVSGATLKNIGIVGAKTCSTDIESGILACEAQSSIISSCFSKGLITADVEPSDLFAHYAFAGGLVGRAKKCTISDCMSSVRFEAEFEGTPPIFFGGIVAILENSAVTCCYSTGKASAVSSENKLLTKSNSHFGAIVGEIIDSNSTIESCFYLNSFSSSVGVNRETAVVNAKQLTASAMKKQKSFDGFDFASVWLMPQNSGYPTLAINSSVTIDKYEIKLKIGEEAVLSALSTGVGISVWASSDGSIASVVSGEGNATVKGASIGSSTITAIASNGKAAVCEVNVYKPSFWQWLIDLLVGWLFK